MLSVAIVLDGITCPLYWIVFSRPGATGLQHWQQVLTPAVDALFLRGLTRFTRLLCAVNVSRVRQFFEQLFNGYRWLDTLHQPFHPKC